MMEPLATLSRWKGSILAAFIISNMVLGVGNSLVMVRLEELKACLLGEGAVFARADGCLGG